MAPLPRSARPQLQRGLFGTTASPYWHRFTTTTGPHTPTRVRRRFSRVLPWTPVRERGVFAGQVCCKDPTTVRGPTYQEAVHPHKEGWKRYIQAERRSLLRLLPSWGSSGTRSAVISLSACWFVSFTALQLLLLLRPPGQSARDIGDDCPADFALPIPWHVGGLA